MMETQPGKTFQSDEGSWQQLLGRMLAYSNTKIGEDQISEIIASALDVFANIPNAASVALFSLDPDTFDFHLSRVTPIHTKEAIENNYRMLIDEGAVGNALDSGKVLYWESKKVEEGSPYYMIAPLIVSSGVLGFVLVNLDSPSHTLQQIVLGLTTLFADQFASNLHSARLLRDLQSSQSILEQKIALRTQKIQDSKQELQIILDSVQAGTIIYDTSSARLTNANKVAVELIGKQRKDVIGASRNDFIIPKPEKEASFYARLPKGIPFECLIKRESGELVPVISRVTTVHLGTHEYLIESFVDITELKQAETALRDSEKKFRTIFEKAGIGMSLCDLDAVIIEANDAFAKMLGFSSEELNGIPIEKISHPDDFAKEKVLFAKLKAGNTEHNNFETEKRYLRKNGDIVWGRLTSTFIQDSNGNSIFGLGMVEDITDRKKSEVALIRQTNILNGVADATSSLLTLNAFSSAIYPALESLGKATEVDRVSLYRIDYDKSNGNSQFVNQMYVWDKQAIVPSDGSEILKHVPISEFFPAWYDDLRDGISLHGLVRSLNNSEKDILEKLGVKSFLFVPVIVQEQLWGMLGFDDCETERIWSEVEESILKATATSIGGAILREQQHKELVSAKEKAEEASKIKSILLTNMSHEFRTPLNGILGFTQILRDESPGEEFNELIDGILVSSKRLMSTLNLILNLSELESGKLKTMPQEFCLDTNLNYAIRQFSEDAEDKKIALTFIAKRKGINLIADHRLFSETMKNLIDNAIKYTESGSVKIETDLIEEDLIYWATIKVIDTGIGIEKEQLDFIFQEFRQGSEGLSRRFEGSGLGLTISRKMIELMGGSLSVESKVGEGSVFTVKLPATIAEPEIGEADLIEKEFYQQAAKDRNGAKEDLPSILLVEDNLVNIRLVQIFLMNICKVEFAENAFVALDLIEKNEYPLILIDINLGAGMSGIDLLKKVRKINGYKTIPIVAVTGYALLGDKEQLLDEGFTHYLPKPFNRQELENLVVKLLKQT